MNRASFRISGVLFAVIASLAMIVCLIAPASATTPVSPGVNLAQLVAQVNSLQSQVNTQQATINNLQTTVNAQAATIAALQAKTASISVQNGVGTNTELFFTGVNVH